jgi:AcrR family transcriptional regulator
VGIEVMTVSSKTAGVKTVVVQSPVERIKRPKRNEKGWQAEKSAMTRLSILEATIQCLLELGYANTTTALIANYAGVSRGAMMHHFPSRMSVIKAAVDYLHVLRLREYHEMMSDIDDPRVSLTYEVTLKSVEAAWNYVNLPSFIAYQELMAASRTDAELEKVIGPVEKDFEKQFLRAAKSVFPHVKNLENFTGAHDMVNFVMQGMALSHMSMKRNSRAKVVITSLADMLHNIYRDANLIDD